MKNKILHIMLLFSLLLNFAMASSLNFSAKNINKESKKSAISRTLLTELLTNATKHTNYIAIASHRSQVMGINLPENSLSAIENAAEYSQIEILELDIKLTSDNIPYLMHDNYLQRTTNFVDTVVGEYGAQSYGLTVGTYDSDIIKRLFLKRLDGTYSDDQPPFFSEVLAWVKTNTNMLINLDINDDRVFAAVWNEVKKQNAFQVCIFKGRYSYDDFKKKYYDTLTNEQKTDLIYFPMIPNATKNSPNEPMKFYISWEDSEPQIAKGYEVGFKKDPPNAQVPTEAAILDVVEAIRAKKRVRVHAFASMPDNYLGRYMGDRNINQCCNASVDSRGDWQYLLAPRPEVNGWNMDYGVDGYIITDDPVTLNRYLTNLGKRILAD